ncbi:MAG: hypothetical protein QOF73_5399 [Thermomicrobiales bacterium]|jgi:hypothetical protein|nr:hypothetical protein [Thermomicrobiales bacterium]
MTSREQREVTHADRIIGYLRSRIDGASDAEVAAVLGLSHQRVNQVCRRLANPGQIARARGEQSIVNRLLDAPGGAIGPSNDDGEPPRGRDWEGNVQSEVVAFLSRTGWSIRRVAGTESREPGRDIEAEREGVRLWVTVKGYPTGTNRTAAPTQARHWFQSALFDVILWRGEDRAVRIAIALPRRPTYLKLAARTTWFREAAQFQYLWVDRKTVLEE